MSLFGSGAGMPNVYANTTRGNTQMASSSMSSVSGLAGAQNVGQLGSVGMQSIFNQAVSSTTVQVPQEEYHDLQKTKENYTMLKASCDNQAERIIKLKTALKLYACIEGEKGDYARLMIKEDDDG